MILATHALGGTAAALLARRYPVLSFLLAITSHFILDSIPHWDYPVRSLERSVATGERIRSLDRTLARDIAFTTIDFFVGAGLSLFLARPTDAYSFLIVALGIVGGVLPDFLQLVYYVLKSGMIVKLQQFHVWVHARDRRLKSLPFVGMPFLLAIAGMLAGLIVYIR